MWAQRGRTGRKREIECQRFDAVLDIEGARRADDLFQGIADRLEGEFDG